MGRRRRRGYKIIGQGDFVARRLADQFDAVCVLKSAGTVVAEKGCLPWVLPVGSAALAKAGTGDVLAGMIAALIAQGLIAWDASVMAVGMHARAADLAVQVLGERAVMAEDLMGYFT